MKRPIPIKRAFRNAECQNGKDATFFQKFGYYLCHLICHMTKINITLSYRKEKGERTNNCGND